MRNGHHRKEALVRRVLGILLHLYPSSFRRDVGQDLIETAMHRRNESVRRHPATGAIRFWLTEGVRFVFDGVLERMQAWPSLSYDLRQAWRQIRRAPSQHALAIATLAVGVGATTAVFTLADTVVFRPLPYADARALYLIHVRFGGTELSSNSLPNLRDLQATISTMTWLDGASDRSPALADQAGDAERVSVLDVTEGYLPRLGARLVMGRPFNDQDRAAGAARVAIVSHELWRRRWTASPAVLGASVRLNGTPYTIVGVMAPAFRDPEPIESGAVTGMWVPVRAGDFKDRDDFTFRVLGRLSDKASLETARQELSQAGRRLAADHPENRVDGADLDFILHPLHQATVAGARDRILLLLGAVGLLLTLACANAASLFLARGVARSPELAMRSALGASRSQLALQLFGETLLTAAIAGVIGGFLGAVGLRAFVAAAPSGVPRLHELGLDLRALVAVGGLTGLTALMFGIVPALRGARAASPTAAANARLTASRSTQRLQSILVAVEVAISLVLVTSAGLLLASVRHLLNVPPGFDAANVLVVDLRPPFTARTNAATRDFHAALLERAAATPGVARAALAFAAPGTPGGAWMRVTPDNAISPLRGSEPGRAPAYGAVAPGPNFFSFNAVSTEFFAVLDIPLRAGRLFNVSPQGSYEVVLSESAARRFFPGDEHPIGRRLILGTPGADVPIREVVGIVGDIRQRGPATEIEPQTYLPYQQRDVGRMSLLLEPDPGLLLSADAIRRLVRGVAPDVPVDRIEPLATRYAATRAETRLLAALLTAFAAIGLILAAVGTYATVSHTFSRRVREMAIRLALGADEAGVFRLVLSRAFTVAAAGIAAGFLLTLLLSRFLEGQLHGVTARDPLTSLAATGAIVAAVALAALGPALRAARVDPNKVLRTE
jgi:predicted permease